MAKYFPVVSHAAILSGHPAFDWTAVVDPSLEARDRAAVKWRVPCIAGSMSELQDPGDFDCAVIATPPADRTSVLDALPGLKVVMLEKPVADTLDGAEKFAKTCAKRGIAVQVNYWRRGVAGFQALAQGELTRRIGEVRAVLGVYGGGLRNSGSHMIDFIRLLLGEVAQADQAVDIRPAPDVRISADVAASIGLTLANGTPVCLLPIDFADYRETCLDIWGALGRLTIEQESLVTRAYPRVRNRGLEGEWEIASDAPETLDMSVSEAFTSLYDNLADAADGGVELFSPLASALVTERILNEIAPMDASVRKSVRTA